MNTYCKREKTEKHAPGGVPSAHVDRVIYSMMPPEESWPVFDYSGDNIPVYPDRMNAVEVLLDSAVRDGFGDKTAFHYEGESWTYRQLQECVEKIARVLVEEFGLVPGNRVLLRSGNCPMLAACWLAVLKAGGICITTMPLLKEDELAFILDRVRVRFALCEVSLADEMEGAARSTGIPDRVACFTPLGTARSGEADLDYLLQRTLPGFTNVATAADDIALIAFTSGTTGRPKAAVHCHRDIIVIGDCYPRAFSIDAGDVICGSPSMAFTYGLAVFLIYPLRYRATVVYVPTPSPERVLEAVKRYGVTCLYGVPTAYRQLLQGLNQFDIGSVRKCASSGENLQPALWEAWFERTGLRIVNGFGATELICTFLSESMNVDRVGSTGRPVPGYTVRLIDDDGHLLPPHAKGRLAVRGPTGCRYLDDEEQQRLFVQNGWNVTSDIFVRDGEGYLWYVDRLDDMIVSSGYNVSPQEVERALLGHPWVQECAVVGVDDDVRGKLVRACVVLKERRRETRETISTLQEYVKHRIAPYKYPRDIRFYNELPKTHTGKIQRHQLRLTD